MVEYLAVEPGAIVVDATIGLGGHAALILPKIGPTGLLIGIDVDEGNLRIARQRFSDSENVRLFRANFKEIEAVLKEADVSGVDAVIADLGVSSNVLNDPSRGLSFNESGPLDMRLDSRLEDSAADLVNRLGETELADLLYHNSQERFSRRIARAIHQARRDSRITTTDRLSGIVCDALKQDPKSHGSKLHPATRTFLALRIAVNRELEALDLLLEALPRVLKPGGRAAVISFHSLEDGAVKRAFRSMKERRVARILTKKPITPSEEERKRNPRSRSSKMRVIERTSD